MTGVHHGMFVSRWCQGRVQIVPGKFGCAGSHGDTAATQADIAGRFQAAPRTQAGHGQTQTAVTAAHRQHSNTQLAVCVTWGDTGVTWAIFPAHQVVFQSQIPWAGCWDILGVLDKLATQATCKTKAKGGSKSQLDDYERDLSSMRSFCLDIPLALSQFQIGFSFGQRRLRHVVSIMDPWIKIHLSH